MPKSLTAAHTSIRELILSRFSELTPAERQVGRVILDVYPTAGLQSVAELRLSARVSAPTVFRFSSKIGFDSFNTFQQAIRDEVQRQMDSPLSLYATFRKHADYRPGRELYRGYFHALASNLDATAAKMSAEACDAIVHVLADTRRSVLCIGGRMSKSLASAMAFHLHLLRPGVTLFNSNDKPPADTLLDVGRRHVVVVFDFRRFEDGVIRFARIAAERGATIVLITDPFLSPIAEFADHMVMAESVVPSPLDSMVPGLAVAEALLAGVVAALGARAKTRMKQLEATRETYPKVAVESKAAARRARKG